MKSTWALILACVLTAPAAAAQLGDSESRMLARDLATQGADAFDRGDYEMALDRFNRAATVLDAPTITLMQARSLAKLGRWTEAVDKLHQTAHIAVTPNTAPPFVTAIQDAAREAQELERVMPRLTIVVEQPANSADEISISIDGRQVPSIAFNVPRSLDPGAHTIQAASHGKDYFTSTLELHPEQTQEVRIPTHEELHPKPVIAAPVAAPRPVRFEATGGGSASPSWLLPVGVGATAVGGISAIITGILAATNQSKLDDACQPTSGDSLCRPEQRDEIAALKLQRGLFIASAAVTLVGAGVTTYVLMTDPEFRLAVQLEPSGAAITGRF